MRFFLKRKNDFNKGEFYIGRKRSRSGNQDVTLGMEFFDTFLLSELRLHHI